LENKSLRDETNIDRAKGQRVLDDWIAVDGTCEATLEALEIARREINACVDLRVMNPRHPLPEAKQEIIDQVCYCFDVLDEDSSSEW
jgi:hypothetical protein